LGLEIVERNKAEVHFFYFTDEDISEASEPDPKVSCARIGCVIHRLQMQWGVIRDVDGRASGFVSARGWTVSKRSDGRGMGTAKATDPECFAGRAATQDRHAFSNERDPLLAANRVSLAIFAEGRISAALDRLQHLPQIPERWHLGYYLGASAR
jgi:hypothetical protein